MANITIRNVPEELVDRLKETARRNNRSMEQELRVLLHERFGARPAVMARIRERWSTRPAPQRDQVDAWLAEARDRSARGH